MNLEDALGGWPSGGNNQSGGGGPWPGQPTNPTWPGQPTSNPTWPGAPAGGQPGGPWPGQPSQPNQPTWPGQPSQPNQPAWPGQPSQPNQPAWPGQPSQPSAPGGWPSPSPGPGPGPGPGPSFPVAPQQSLAVPYKQDFPGGLHDKQLITIEGTVPPGADKFTVDLNTSNDLAFHFNPRFNESGKKVIVRNSCIGKKWGKEERDLQRFPFVQGQPFQMKILCTTKEFRVAINDSHLLEFRHRITDLRAIVRLNIYYDVKLSKVHMETLP